MSTRTQGSDQTGSVTVHLDGAGRVEEVVVAFQDEGVRRADRFAEAFDEAWTHARGAALPAVEPVPEGEPLRTRRITRPARVPLRDLVKPHLNQPFRQPVGTGGAGIDGGETGASDNDCVHVVLDHGPGGRLTVDQGWLANATGAQVGRAVQQAFEAAYRTREER